VLPVTRAARAQLALPATPAQLVPQAARVQPAPLAALATPARLVLLAAQVVRALAAARLWWFQNNNFCYEAHSLERGVKPLLRSVVAAKKKAGSIDPAFLLSAF
jgi:hypothetical protein